MKIAFVHFPGRLARLERARDGTGPTEFLFGSVELERAGHEVEHYEVDPDLPSSRTGRWLIDLNAGRGHLPPHLAAGVLSGTRRLLPALRAADVVVATTTGTAMALAVWSTVGAFPPVVGIVAGLLNHPWRTTRRRTTLPLLRQMAIVLYGRGEVDGIVALDAELARRVHVVPFGVDTAYWSPAAADVTPGVLAIGNDGHRDWRTLVRAARDIPAPVHIFTGHPRPPELPENVFWRPADWYRSLLSDDEVRDLYRHAAVVAVPVEDVPQPSGQSVTLQAMACGRPVVLSRTRGLWAPESLHGGEDVVFVPPHDPGRLARAVGRLLADEAAAARIGAAARTNVVHAASVQTYAERLLDVCRLAVERS